MHLAGDAASSWLDALDLSLIWDGGWVGPGGGAGVARGGDGHWRGGVGRPVRWGLGRCSMAHKG